MAFLRVLEGMRRRLKVFITTLVLLIIPPCIYALYEIETGNFHTITSGEAYRSGQLDRNRLAYYIKAYKIKSILNLRGEKPGSKWYVEEMRTCAENSVMHYDVSLSAYSEPIEEDVRKLMTVFRSAPRPILIHCEGGADRSGLVSAMWKVVVDGEPKSEAEKQLFLLYGHIPFGKAHVMDRFFREWRPEISRLSE